jgi:Bacterial archaeo-eukaryotic release factor family 3
MNLFTSTPKREAIATVQFLPAVSIIMPFTPVITLKKTLEYSLKNVMGKVEAMLSTHYTVEKAIPVIIKLRNLISSLNYNTHKKSIAIFVSPVVEKVYYFGIEMEEKIVIDPSFTISDLVCCKKEKQEYLILLLSDKFSKMYLGDGTQLELIKSNSLINTQGSENITAEKMADFAFVADQKECITNMFLFQMDQGLSIILKSYPLPVFVIGQEKLLEHFKKITKNDENLVHFIHGNYEEASESDLGCVMKHFLSFWNKLKQQHLLKQIKKAKEQNKLRIGIEEISKATTGNRGKLLIVEKKLVNHSQTSKTYNPFFKTDSNCNEVFFIKDEVDDIIKNVFENGGDVEFIDDELLKDHRHIVLIERN